MGMLSVEHLLLQVPLTDSYTVTEAKEVHFTSAAHAGTPTSVTQAMLKGLCKAYHLSVP